MNDTGYSPRSDNAPLKNPPRPKKKEDEPVAEIDKETDDLEHDWRVHPREIIEKNFKAYDMPLEEIDDLIGQSADDPLTLDACKILAETFGESVEFWHNTWRLHTIDLIKDLDAARKTLRDEFAMAALAASSTRNASLQRIAEHAYEVADAMVEVRKNESI